MYGRLVEIEGIDPSKREEALGNMRDRVIPMLKEMDGFAGFIALADEDAKRARNVVLWESQESAEEAERKMATIREQMVTGMGATVRSADLYEALIVNVQEAARV
jgi:heme-degrading monooxygenase HmoA